MDHVGHAVDERGRIIVPATRGDVGRVDTVEDRCRKEADLTVGDALIALSGIEELGDGQGRGIAVIGDVESISLFIILIRLSGRHPAKARVEGETAQRDCDFFPKAAQSL